MNKKLTVHNAEILTASVEIKTLTVSGKQVTLAVFRQLLEVPLITDGNLNGVPWGFVNYHPDGSCKALPEEHRHVVWQSGSDLLRSRVDKVEFREVFQPEVASSFLLACIWEHINGGTPHLNNEPLLRHRADSHLPDARRTLTVAGITVRLAAHESVRQMVKANEDLFHARAVFAQPTPEAQEHRRYLVEMAEGNLARVSAPLEATYRDMGRTANDLWAELKATCEAEASRRKRHDALLVTLSELPQLFIAV